MAYHKPRTAEYDSAVASVTAFAAQREQRLATVETETGVYVRSALAAGMSLRDLAELFGVAYTTVKAWAERDHG